MNVNINKSILNGYKEVAPDNSLVFNVVKYFEERIPEQIEHIKINIQKNNSVQICKHLHAIKNSFLNVGALDTAEQCQKIEDNVPQMKSGELGLATKNILEAHRNALVQLKEYIDDLEKPL